MSFDAANGVGTLSIQGLMKVINAQDEILKVDICNINIAESEKLNSNCGADFVKVSQRVPEEFNVIPLRRCVSVDGDADRVIYFYTDGAHKFCMLDGDRIATLSK